MLSRVGSHRPRDGKYKERIVLGKTFGDTTVGNSSSRLGLSSVSKVVAKKTIYMAGRFSANWYST